MLRIAYKTARHRLIGGLFIAVPLVGALAVLALMASGRDSTQAAFQVSDPVAGQVATVAADMATTGNGSTKIALVGGPVNTSISGIAVNATHNVDVVVDEIAAADGSAGFGLSILYDPAVIQITANNFGINYAGCIDFEAQPLPDSDGDYRTDVACFSPQGLSGEILLTRMTVKCIANGTSVFDVNDLLGGDGVPDVFNAAGGPLAVVTQHH